MYRGCIRIRRMHAANTTYGTRKSHHDLTNFLSCMSCHSQDIYKSLYNMRTSYHLQLVFVSPLQSHVSCPSVGFGSLQGRFPYSKTKKKRCIRTRVRGKARSVRTKIEHTATIFFCQLSYTLVQTTLVTALLVHPPPISSKFSIFVINLRKLWYPKIELTTSRTTSSLALYAPYHCTPKSLMT